MKNLTDEDFDRILQMFIVKDAATLLSVGGVYECLSEYYNNNILKHWENEQEIGEKLDV